MFESDKIASSGFIIPTTSFLRIKFYSEVSLSETMSECMYRMYKTCYSPLTHKARRWMIRSVVLWAGQAARPLSNKFRAYKRSFSSNSEDRRVDNKITWRHVNSKN